MKKIKILKYISILSFLLMACAGPKQNTSALPDLVPVSEEIFMGNELSQECEQVLPLLKNEQIENYLNEIVTKISKFALVQSFDCRIYIVDKPDINHFSLPGGHIYLYRGLLESADNLNEIAVVIAHEIEHISARNGLERIYSMYPYAFAAQSVLGYNPEITRQIVANLFENNSILSYSTESELSADEKAIEYAYKANFNPKGMITYLEKINKTALSNPEILELLQKTHPEPERRLKRTQPDITRMDITSSMIENTPEFTALKTLLSK